MPRTPLVRRGRLEGTWPDPDPPRLLDLPHHGAAQFAARPLTARQWIVEPLIPVGETTLVYGPGAAGKSLLLLQLCIAMASGKPWLGTPVPTARVLFMTCEDDPDEINRRAAAVLASYGAGWSDCSDRFAVVAMRESEAPAVLAVAARDGTLTPTPTYEALKRRVAAYRPDVVVIDTLADVFGGNENDRGQAKQFVKLIEGLGRCTFIVTAHPSVSGQADGRGASGSTGWPAAVRSHLYMERVRSEEGAAADPDLRELSNKKSNYAQAGSGALTLRWRAGVFERVNAFDEAATEVAADALFLELLERYGGQGRYVSASPGPTYAPTVFAREEQAKASRIGKAAMTAAMNRLFGTGHVRTMSRKVSGHDRTYLAVSREPLVNASSTRE